MTRKLTIKQEAFARAYVETGNASEAYRRAYNTKNMTDKSVIELACRNLSNVNITSMVEQLQSKAQKRHEITVESLTGQLQEAAELGMDEKANISAAVTAIMGIAKLHGLVIDRGVNQNTNATIEDKPKTKEDWRSEHTKSAEHTATGATNGHLETPGRPAARLN